MFIDYVPLMLINMATGFFLLGCYVYWGLNGSRAKNWIPGFSMVGIVALVNGYRMSFVWPLPGSYNVAFGEMSVLFGILFLGAALGLAKEWDLISVAIYGFFAGSAALLIGIRIHNLAMTKDPLLSSAGFILSGISGILATPMLYLRTRKTIRMLGAIVLIVTSMIWFRTGYKAYWSHLADFAKWVPQTMQATSH